MLTSTNDNPLYIPFIKGPFKGKGANRVAVRELVAEMAQIRKAMDQLIATYNATFARPRLVNLGLIQRRNTYPLMWWRESVGGGPFIQLFQSERSDRGRELLRKAGPNTVSALRDFDRQRLILNFRSKIVGSALEAFVIYERGVDELECEVA